MLSGSKIKQELNRTIFITPFSEKHLNSNSYDLTLDRRMLVYQDQVLDMKLDNPTKEIIIPENGIILNPGELYLAATKENTYTTDYIPRIEGRSSIARLGLFVHISAGLGEAGFHGHWTLEMTCVKPLRIYPDISICQIFFCEIEGEHDLCHNANYQNSTKAIPSRLYRELEEKNHAEH